MSAQTVLQNVPEAKTPDYGLLAKMVITEGKTFKEGALAAGYSVSVAARGLKALMDDSKPVAEAVRRESERLMTLDKLKPLAVARLYSEITNPKSSQGIKAIELAGRFKETDWFVRNTDINIGVFTALGEAGPAIDAVANVIPSEE